MNLFEPLLPTGEDLDFVKESLQKGMDWNVAHGWTAIHDSAQFENDTNMLKELHKEGKMKHRVFASANIRFKDQTLTAGIYDSGDHMYQLAGIKLYIDGTLGSRSAALLENYNDADHPGLFLLKEKTFTQPWWPLLKRGFKFKPTL